MDTNDEMVARVIAREAVLRAEIKQRTEELNRLQIYLSVHQELSGVSVKGDEPGKVETPPIFLNNSVDDFRPVLKDVPRGISQADFVPFARALILEHGRPMEKKGMLDGFKRRGCHVEVKEESKLRNLGKKLMRAKKEIIHISGSGYWSIDIPCPEVIYTPSQANVRDR